MKYTVLHLDANENSYGDSFEDCEITFDNEEVPLTLYFGPTPADVVGYAILSKDKNKVNAEINFHKNISAEQMQVYKTLAPCIGAKILERDERSIKKIEINVVSLDILNSDGRIGSLHRQEKDAKQTN